MDRVKLIAKLKSAYPPTDGKFGWVRSIIRRLKRCPVCRGTGLNIHAYDGCGWQSDMGGCPSCGGNNNRTPKVGTGKIA